MLPPNNQNCRAEVIQWLKHVAREGYSRDVVGAVVKFPMVSDRDERGRVSGRSCQTDTSHATAIENRRCLREVNAFVRASMAQHSSAGRHSYVMLTDRLANSIQFLSKKHEVEACPIPNRRQKPRSSSGSGTRGGRFC